MRLGSVLAVTLGLVVAAPPAAGQALPRAADEAMSLNTFLLNYRCAVVERLAIIHENREQGTNRYFVLSLKHRMQSYVQCIFLDGDQRMLCEAASGYYATPAVQDRAYRLPPHRVATLARLGFDTDDSQGNFQKMIEFDGAPDLAAVADLILSTLYEVYDARVGSNLKWHSPLADFDPRESDCIPIG